MNSLTVLTHMKLMNSENDCNKALCFSMTLFVGAFRLDFVHLQYRQAPALPCPGLTPPRKRECCGTFLSGLARFPGSDAEQPKRVELSQIATSPPSPNTFIRNPASRVQLYITTSTQLPHT